MSTPALNTPPVHAVPAVVPARIALDDWAWIRAEGPDAASFLQGQLTQDVLGLTDDRARPAGYCTPKGRLLATFVMWREGPEAFGLACSRDLVEPTLKRLRMFVLRAKCVLSIVEDRPLQGVLGDLPAALGQEAWSVARVDGQCWIRLPSGEGLPARALVVPGAHTPRPETTAEAAAAWALGEVASAVPRVVAATADHFVPQMVNLELVGGVHFQKGCYPGQEVVARSQYRGTLKRRAFLLASPVPLPPGAEIYHADDPEQPAGEVVMCAARDDGHLALAELKIAATQVGTLHALCATGPVLTPVALPYPFPTEA